MSVSAAVPIGGAERQLRRAQAGVGEDRVQGGAEPRAEPHGLEGAHDPGYHLAEQRQIGRAHV